MPRPCTTPPRTGGSEPRPASQSLRVVGSAVLRWPGIVREELAAGAEIGNDTFVGSGLPVATGWRHGPREDKGARWDPAEVGAVVGRLLAQAPVPEPVYGAS